MPIIYTFSGTENFSSEYNSCNLTFARLSASTSINNSPKILLKFPLFISSIIEIFIDKKIPVSAGLAGGSTDAAGTLVGLNKIFGEPLNTQELHELCARLGSDLNVCLEGGCVLATSRGEVIEKLPYNLELPVTLIKPKKLGISAKEAYTKYSLKENKPQNNMTEKMLNALKNHKSIKNYLYNDLEYAIFDDYSELQDIKEKLPQSIMSGSGSTYFVLENMQDKSFSDDYQVI